MTSQASGYDPILCAHLLRRVDEKLIELLLSLSASEWDVQTVAPRWKVRDVAAHLLDTVLRKLSLVRDSWCVETVDIRSPEDVGALVNRLNEEGVTVYRRLSPPVLIDIMKTACEQSASFHESLDPFAPAAFGVIGRPLDVEDVGHELMGYANDPIRASPVLDQAVLRLFGIDLREPLVKPITRETGLGMCECHMDFVNTVIEAVKIVTMPDV